jgi:DNA mismatch endonuclease (patch repair protein)
VDNLSPKERSQIMARVRSRDTRPEMFVRRIVFSLGYRYRLHVKNLPGRPDLVFRRLCKVIFVHGCFWHRHFDCALARLPKSRQDFWIPKLEGNRRRDEQTVVELRKLGWGVMTIWECELGKPASLTKRIRRFLNA